MIHLLLIKKAASYAFKKLVRPDSRELNVKTIISSLTEQLVELSLIVKKSAEKKSILVSLMGQTKRRRRFVTIVTTQYISRIGT